MKGKNRTIFNFLLLFFLALTMMSRQLWIKGYFSSFIEDGFTYTSWAWQFVEAFREGIVYPRWTPLDFWGYGSPTFVLYPPLAFYLVTLFNVLAGSIVVSMNMAKFVALFFSGMGMFFLVREFYSERIALLSASFYIIFPFNILQMYLIGTFSSTISLMWFSPILLFIYRYFGGGERRQLIYAGVCYGGLILTHLINAYMFTFVIVLFVIYMSVSMKRPKYLLALPVVITAGVLISAAYIFPVGYEMTFLNLISFIGAGGGFYFSDFFVLPNLTSKLPSDHFWPVYYSTIVFYLFFFCLLMVLFLLQVLRLRRMDGLGDRYAVSLFSLGTAAGTIFLLFGGSTFLWKAIPFFEYIQFPTRWLNITVFGVVFLSSAYFYVLKNSDKTEKRCYLIIASLFLLCLLLDVRYISYSHAFRERDLVPVKAVNYATEHLPSGITIDGIDKNSGEKDKVVITDGEGETEVILWKSAERIIKAAANGPVRLRVRTFNFPGWTAYMDGVKTEIGTEEGTGAILVDIPQGRHTLELRFVDTPIRFYSKIISLVSFLAFTFLAVFPGRKGNKDK